MSTPVRFGLRAFTALLLSFLLLSSQLAVFAQDAIPGGATPPPTQDAGGPAAPVNACGDVGGISGNICLNVGQTVAPLSPGSLIISEFRLRGPNGANDEFEEVYNTTNLSITVADVAAGAGYGIVASDGTLRCTIPNGTVIPARGHYLCANSVGYSLAGYAAANATYTTDIPDNAGIALFQTTTAASFTLANRLDAVGSTSEANTLYKEGTGYPALTPFSIDYSFYRDLCNLNPSTNRCTAATGDASNYGGGAGVPKDTGNNAADFLFVDTNGTSAGAGQRLGAPGPENLASPVQRNSTINENPLDSTKASSVAPNRVRDFTSDPANNSTFGTLSIRRRYQNNTGSTVTSLRLRIVNITTFPSPSGTADLHPRTSSNVVVSGITDPATCASTGTPTTTPCQVTVLGTTLQQPPSQPNGGGFNSSMLVTLPGGGLANNASVDVQLLLGLQQTGSFRLLLNIEGLP